MGRSVLITGHHASKAEVPLMSHAPLQLKPKRVRNFKRDWPGFVLNTSTIKLFNSFYYASEGRKGEFRSDYDKFFYPLDKYQNWNRMYGKRGFVQYQFVVPRERAQSGVTKAIEILSKSGRASFLAVLKRMGPPSQGLMSFPLDGYTLALDIPLTNDLTDFLRKLDDVVLEHGGRVYLAKDSRLPAETFRKMYPRYEEFVKAKRSLDPGNRFTSDLARRLELLP
jgi:FAD/FMN-containing dehydrogenase